MFKLKSNDHNKSHPEGLISEWYLAEECMIFVFKYFYGVETSLSACHSETNQ